MSTDIFQSKNENFAITRFSCGVSGRNCPQCQSTVRMGYQFTIGIDSEWMCSVCLELFTDTIRTNFAPRNDASMLDANNAKTDIMSESVRVHSEQVAVGREMLQNSRMSVSAIDRNTSALLELSKTINRVAVAVELRKGT